MIRVREALLGIGPGERSPDQLDRLRQEPDLWPNAVDEVLRYDPPVLFTGRFTEHGAQLAGQRISSGYGVLTVLAGANASARSVPDEAKNLLAKALRPFILRRTKEQVAKDLPEKLEQTIYCELDSTQRWKRGARGHRAPDEAGSGDEIGARDGELQWH